MYFVVLFSFVLELLLFNLRHRLWMSFFKVHRVRFPSKISEIRNKPSFTRLISFLYWLIKYRRNGR